MITKSTEATAGKGQATKRNGPLRKVKVANAMLSIQEKAAAQEKKAATAAEKKQEADALVNASVVFSNDVIKQLPKSNHDVTAAAKTVLDRFKDPQHEHHDLVYHSFGRSNVKGRMRKDFCQAFTLSDMMCPAVEEKYRESRQN